MHIENLGANNMSGKNIKLVAGDRGGLYAVMRVVMLAVEAGNHVSMCLTDTCAELYQADRLDMDNRIKVITADQEDRRATFLTDGGTDFLILGVSQKDEGVLAAIVMGTAYRGPRILVDDLYGSSRRTLDSLNQQGCLDDNVTVCVPDEFTRSKILEQFDLESQVVVTGGPQFDGIVEARNTWDGHRRELRAAINAKNDDLVFLVVGQLNGTAEIVSLIEKAVKNLEMLERVIIVCRKHPRNTWLDEALMGHCMRCTGLRVEDPGLTIAPDSEALLPAADFVMSGYSPTNQYAILLEMRGVIYAGVPSLIHDLYQEKGITIPPEVEAGAAWYVSDPDELANVIQDVTTQADSCQSIRNAQAAIAEKHDGHAAERVWEIIERQL